MNKHILLSLIIYLFTIVPIEILPQLIDSNSADSSATPVSSNQLFYVANPNHREIIIKSVELAVVAGFVDTLGISLQEIKDRVEAGSYCEDFEAIPGIIGAHFPNPWDQGPDFNFFGYYPFSKIPYGSYRNPSSGWYRGLNHGYDPVQGFKWPGANSTTIEWANFSGNAYTWNYAVELYKSGEYAKAYQCLGHLLHLLADLSIPSHVKIVNHGMDVVELNQGTQLNPDKLELIIDEYELAISGGIIVPGIVYIPSILSEFRNSLNLADKNNIPGFYNWQEYFVELGKFTYNNPVVSEFYQSPTQNGGWGSALDENGIIKNPSTYATLPLVEINGEWFELKIKSTATPNGPIIPQSKMIEMNNDLVPKVVEYGAGLIMKFNETVTDVEAEEFQPVDFILNQNYPNPFNPTTTIQFSLPQAGDVTLKIYNSLGEEVRTLVNEHKGIGKHSVQFTAINLSSGIYFYKLQLGTLVEIKKMILIK